MNLLITGSSGLIGGHVLESLSDIQGKKYCISRSGIEVESEDFIHINLDISEPNFAKDLPKDVDCIIHLAQSPFYQEFPEHVDHVFNVNLNATHELLEFGYKLKIKNFIYASSGGIYDSSDDLISEQNSFKQYSALGHYLATKLSSEIFVSQFSNFFNTQILRFFFVYGPRQHKRMLIPRLIDNVYRGNEINIFGEKGIKINPIYGEDAAHALTKSIFNETSNVYNIAGLEEIYMLDLVKMIERLLNKEANIKKLSGESGNLIGNTEKMVSELHCPKIDIKKGIGKIIEENYTSSDNSRR